MVSVISTMDADNLHVYRPTLYVCVARKTMVHPDLYHASAHFAHVLKSLDHASKSLVHRIELTCTMVAVISTMDGGNLHVHQPTLYVCVARKTMYHPDLYHDSAHFPMC